MRTHTALLLHPSTTLAIGTFFALAVLSPADRSYSQSSAAPERIDLVAFPGQIIDQVVIPIPAEVFAVLDKVGDPDWGSGIVHIDRDLRIGDRAFLALFFGSLVAEGFIAVQAESLDDIQKIGIRSLELAEALGLEKAVKPHSLSVVESAKEGDWNKVRSDLDSTQQTVRDTMTKQRDQELSELVSLGGWLRGTNVLTSMIAEDYTSDKAELLNQPDLVRHFRELIASMRGPVRQTREISEIDKGLGRIAALLRDSEDFGLDMVKKLNGITQEMLDQFYFETQAGSRKDEKNQE